MSTLGFFMARVPSPLRSSAAGLTRRAVLLLDNLSLKRRRQQSRPRPCLTRPADASAPLAIPHRRRFPPPWSVEEEPVLFCGISATLTRVLYICCRNGLTESVPKRTMIRALTHGFPRRSFITELAGSGACSRRFFACGDAPGVHPVGDQQPSCSAKMKRGGLRRISPSCLALLHK